jgi:hypothetical protein
MSYQDPEVNRLTRRQLVQIVSAVRRTLWQEDDGTWSPTKEWSSDTVQDISEVLAEFELSPDEPSGCDECGGACTPPST